MQYNSLSQPLSPPCAIWAFPSAGGDDDFESQSGPEDSPMDDPEVLKRTAALFILKVAEKHKLPLSSMESLLFDVQHLIGSVVHQIAEKFTDALSDSNISAASFPGFSEVFQEETLLNPFKGLESTYLQTKYFKEELGLIVSTYINTCCINAM